MNQTTRNVTASPQPLVVCATAASALFFGIALVACGGDDAPPPSNGAGTGSTPPSEGPLVQAGSAAIGTTTAGAAPVGAAGTAGVALTPPASAGSPAAGSGSSSTPNAASASGDVTFHKDIRPIIEARCLGCHVDGASGPFPLDSWTALEPYKGVVVNAVKTRKMPPWLADSTSCTPTRGDQRLTDAQLELFTRWQAASFPIGNEADFEPLVEPATPTVTGEPDKIIKARSPHKLEPGQEYYACLQVDTRIDEDTWVYAMDIVPENPEFVHHAIVSLGSGSCSALGTTAENVYSYRPGSRTLVFEKGDAMLFKAGTVIAIQFHYNTKFASRGMTLPTDHSAYRLWTLPKGTLPERAIGRMGNHDLSIYIPVGAVNQKEGGAMAIESQFTRAGAEIIGISPHMHYLGQSFKETLRKSDGTTTCLVDIPAWDQDWQLDYFYDPKDYIKVSSGDRVNQECLFSNRPEDQGKDPSGKPFTPQYTTFGEDTRQEMCLGYIWFRYPLAGSAR